MPERKKSVGTFYGTPEEVAAAPQNRSSGIVTIETARDQIRDTFQYAVDRINDFLDANPAAMGRESIDQALAALDVESGIGNVAMIEDGLRFIRQLPEVVATFGPRDEARLEKIKAEKLEKKEAKKERHEVAVEARKSKAEEEKASKDPLPLLGSLQDPLRGSLTVTGLKSGGLKSGGLMQLKDGTIIRIRKSKKERDAEKKDKKKPAPPKRRGHEKVDAKRAAAKKSRDEKRKTPR